MIRKGAIVISDKTITIVVDLKDATGGKVKDLQKQLNALDKQAARLANRFKSFSTQRYMATMRFIDRVTAPASRIQKLLQGITTKTWQISFKIADSALSGIRKIESALMRISGKAYNIAVNIKGGAMNKLNNLTSGLMMGAGMFAPVAGLAGVGFGVANAITASAGFEQQMSKVQAITQLKKDSDDMRMLVQQAKDLGMQTAWTRQQVGEAQYYQALAGWTPAQIKAATPHMLNLASAGGMDLGAASDMLTDAMTAFGLKATDKYKNAAGKMIELPEYMADMFAKVQAVSNTGLYELKEATKYSAATIGVMFGNVGGQEGVQLRTEAARQMLVMAGAMANAGIKGSMAGTGINTIFNRLAGENRNTFFASNRLLGIDPTDDKGNLIMPLDYIKAFQKKIRGGMSVDDFMQVAEELSGEKIHADTRRKLNSTIENALKNGGKLGSADMMKIGSMMAGLENAPKLMAMVFQDLEALEAKMNNVEGTAEGMANTMLDNLAGSFTKLGSAWDAFQQDFFTGTAGDGLRGLVDSLTEILTRANKLFQDGVNFSDFGKIIFDVIDRLKNKFLEFNSVGSLLAGGALMAALTKIVRMAQRGVGALKGLAQSAKAGTLGAAASTTGGLSAAQKVGTMTVSAGVVNINGKIAGGAGVANKHGGRSSIPTAGSLVMAQATAKAANLKATQLQATQFAAWQKLANERAFVTSSEKINSLTARAEKLSAQTTIAQLQAQKATATVTAMTNARVAAYREQIAQSKLAIATAREQSQLQRSAMIGGMKSAAGGAAVFAGIFSLLDFMSVKSANAERLAAATSDSERALIARENRKAEWEAGSGAVGSMIFSAIGAGLGSLAGPLGTAIGGVVGGMIGEKLGAMLGEVGAEGEKLNQRNAFDEAKNTQTETTGSWGEFKRMQDEGSYSFLKGISEVQARRRKQDEQELVQLAKETEVNMKYAGRDAWFRQHHLAQYNPFAQSTAEFDYYRQAKAAAGGLNTLAAPLPELTATGNLKNALETALATIMPSTLPDLLWSNKAHAAELTPEQMAQMSAMERGEFYPTGEMTSTGEMPDTTSLTENIYSELEALQEGVNELFSGFGEQITESLTTAFEGVGEVFTGFGESITEGLTSTFDGVTEMFTTFGTSITEGLTATFEGAGEIFTGFGENLTAGMTAAQETVTASLTAIQTTFTTTKEQVQSSWAELPGFFSGIFSGLGGAASAAGAAIAAGLTAPIGTVIGAWQSAAAQISSIISSISAQAAAMPSVPSGGAGFAEGGFVTSLTHFFAGEHGAEAIIPLDPSKRSRALELLAQTEAIVNGASMAFGDDEIDGMDASTPITSGGGSSGGGGSANISVGGVNVNVSFDVSGDDSQGIVQNIQSKIQELTDEIAAQLSIKIRDAFNNKPLYV